MTNPLFIYFNSLSYDKKYGYEEGYVPFAAGRYFSKFADTILHVNQVNIPLMDKKMHHDYLFASIRPKKRFFKNKPKDSAVTTKQLDAVKFFYGVSHKVAADYAKLLKEDDLDELEKLYEGHQK